MSRYNPKNRMEALTYQLEDDVKVLRCLALTDDVKKFKQGLKTMDSHIKVTMQMEKK